MIVILSVLLLAGLLFGIILLLDCAGPLETVTVTEIDRYYEFNAYVNEQLSVEFKGALPKEIPTAWSDLSYSYRYDCSTWTPDPSFSIYLSVKCDDTAAYDKEMARISALALQTVAVDPSRRCYIMSGDTGDYERYMDSEIHDGLIFRFELVIFDDEASTIEYLTAVEWDHKSKDPDAKEVIGSVFDFSKEKGT